MESDFPPQKSGPYTACYALWFDPTSRALSPPRLIDQSLSDYFFYPESEWAKYGYRPPENHPVLGAWRDQTGSVFAFLLDRDPKYSKSKGMNLLLYVAGVRDCVDKMGTKIKALKSDLVKVEKKELKVHQVGQRLDQELKSASISKLVKMIGLFAVVVNAFSLYLRRLPPPDFPYIAIASVYQLLVGAVHFSALLLLLITILIAIGYIIGYGLLMLRRF
jgi:hypothetical protein